MRKGENIIRNTKVQCDEINHQIIIPFFMDETLYYKDALSILKITLTSLNLNSRYKQKVSVVTNGITSSLVNDKLFEFYKNNLIDELIIDAGKIGKVNAVFKVLRSSNAKFITVTDSDVKFLKNWDREVFEIFRSFKKAGAVSPTPVFRTHNRNTLNIWFDNFFSSKLRFTKVVNPNALEKFALSIGWARLDQKFKDVIMTIRSDDGNEAIVGNSHFCVTYRRDIFNQFNFPQSDYLLGGTSEDKFLDKPVIQCDLYRLATQDNYAYHLGNTLEPWMELEEQDVNLGKEELSIEEQKVKRKRVSYFIKFKLFGKLFGIKVFKKWFYLNKGLDKYSIKNFT